MTNYLTEHQNISPIVSRNRPTPFFKCTHPETPIMLSSDQVPSQIEKIVDCGMGHQGISEPAQLTTIFATFPPSKTNYQPVHGELLFYQQSQSASPVRPQLEVRFQKPLTLLPLTATRLGIAHHQFRHKLGVGYPALPHQKNPIPFFKLLPK